MGKLLMTHDELQDKIEAIDYWQEHFANRTFLKALRAVVELHKPQGNFGDTYIDGKPTHPYCPECIDPDVYPCPTIQVIEKELR